MTKGAYFYDACTRVPMIVRGPGVEVGRVAAPVQWHDIAGGRAGSGAGGRYQWSAVYP